MAATVPAPDPRRPEPIPLRALTVLLKYELMISDPRYTKFRLVNTSLAQPGLVSGNPHVFANDAPSVTRRSLHTFLELAAVPSPGNPHPATTCELHPAAPVGVQRLSAADRELIYQETRNHDACYKAIGLFQFFLDLCPPGQQLMYQSGNQQPILLNPQARRVFVYEVHQPRHHTRSYLLKSNPRPGEGPLSPVTGSRSPEDHCVMAFLRPGPQRPDPNHPRSYYVVDMTRMQYGKEALGPWGETYLIGTTRMFEDSMKSVCGHLQLARMDQTLLGGPDHVKVRLKACAARAFQRWQKREHAGWCEHCGMGGPSLFRCTGCRTARIYYCGKEHQEAGWRLHKLHCQRQ
ncbi:uncharacterized protein L3040_007844 [Drepanopeziza brunnea f. sp. 'multigermtubi']|uniref:MYND-type domain-containing protein n=1 Tax=Marssonina brunnea f. sp. multigermtubi (strain MB_m1) TaxID=1072389 RepID=K1WMU8_MARBU|nr:uncharacterized protein MBM_07833 [Drepanopeziza brunnea f. sp. 'multigermtubi' MB_m1]EKD14156.1 hypothetical protein MBM_07833 [Drepanopeziza brunnea f. sp. 'multigermtubi' MB_m1]KAJ5035373.1 hypothetical protein L3040_007844 [Drepanopeziza brunnea f. sp. 'multigermtubi']